MAKYLNRLSARLAREALRESKAWVVSKKLILETDEGDVELEKGDMVDLGATPEGDLAVKSNAAAVVVVSDADLASKIADTVVSSEFFFLHPAEKQIARQSKHATERFIIIPQYLSCLFPTPKPYSSIFPAG